LNIGRRGILRCITSKYKMHAQRNPRMQVHRGSLQDDMYITTYCVAILSCIYKHILELDLQWVCAAYVANVQKMPLFNIQQTIQNP